MEGNINRIDPQDEIQKLKDKVKSLERQLRYQNANSNDLSKRIDSVNSAETFNDSGISCRASVPILDEYELLPVDDIDFSSPETWLCKFATNRAQEELSDLQHFLRMDVNNSNNEFQAIRQCMLKRLEDLEQGSRRCIDTRTFTRPKNRISRPALDTMLESPVVENRQLIDNRQLLTPPWLQMKNLQFESRKFDDFVLNMDNCSILSTTSEPPDSFNITLSMTDKSPLNSTMLLASDYVATQTHNTTFSKAEKPNLNSTKPAVAEQNLVNAKRYISQEQEISFQTTAMNSTYTRVDGCGSSGSSHRSTRTPSCESGMDEDQLSSASDSSYSSANKPMSAGDVQIIANYQEESLKQSNSTPKRGIIDGAFFDAQEDLPSPITASNGPEINHGYLSDHSDHSSAESRAKSSHSSVRSSRSGSPFGSTQLLDNANEHLHHYRPPVGLPQREIKLIRPTSKQEFKRPEVPLMQPHETLGIRPPTRLRAPVKPTSSSTGQQSMRISSGIPRPPSRLPTLRARSSFAPSGSRK